MKLKQTGEQKIIERIFALTGAPPSELCKVLLPNGDDAAVVEINGAKIALSVDAITEDRDFSFNYFTPSQVGAKAVEASVSDIIASGARPLLVLLCVSAAEDFELEKLEELYRGINSSCQRLNIFVAGGDLTTGAEKLCITVTALGTLNSGDKILTRSGAKAGDQIYLSGALGGSGAALKYLQSSEKLEAGLAKKHLEPRCRNDLIGKLAGASCAIDISDGLASEIRHICKASKVGCEILEAQIPLANGVAAAAKEQNLSPYSFAYNGGEDYEILYTLPAGAADPANGTCIGKITDDPEMIVVHGSSRRPLSELGYDNFLRS